MRVVEQVFTLLGRAVERALTGSSDFRFTTSEFRKTSTIQDSVQARMVFQEVQEEVAAGFGLRVQDPVLLDLDTPPVWGWKAAVARAEGQIGRYAPRWMGERRVHRILIVPGLERGRFRGVAAHELVHAWQAEAGVLRRSRGLREGMARWVEYHVLLRARREQDARRLLGLGRYVLGRALGEILDHERRHGREATLDWLRSLDGDGATGERK